MLLCDTLCLLEIGVKCKLIKHSHIPRYVLRSMPFICAVPVNLLHVAFMLYGAFHETGLFFASERGS